MVGKKNWQRTVMTTAVVGMLCLASTDQAMSGEVEARKPATKQRRIIVNDDGEIGMGKDVLGFNPGKDANTIEEFLAARFNYCLNTQVDSYFLCVNGTDRGPLHEGTVLNQPQSTMAQYFYWGERGQIHPDTEKMTRALIERAHEDGMEVVASIRMNDIHDAWKPKLSYPLKLERPDLLLGEKHGPEVHPQDSMMYWFWSGLNYAKAEVRQHFGEFILGYCRDFDYDGVELDFFRHPHFFRIGEEEQNLDTMTRFVRQIRKGLNEIGRQRGRDYLLAVRVPDTPRMCIRTGLDVERWLQEGLVDMLIVGGGYLAYGSHLREFIDMAHRYGVPAYPSTNHFKIPTDAVSQASNFWALGADGVYLFNIHYSGHFVTNSGNWLPDGGVFAGLPHQLGSPDTLLGLNKEYRRDNGCDGHRYAYCGHATPPSKFPVSIVYGTPIELVVGDDVHKAAANGVLKEIRLEVSVDNLDTSEGIIIKINGNRLPQADMKRSNEQQFDAIVQPSVLRRGINEILIVPGPHSISRVSSVITGIKLCVYYKDNA